MALSLSRRSLLQLLGLVALGGAASLTLRGSVPIGRDMRGNQIARDLLHDAISPAIEVTDPTLTLVVFTDYQCPACRRAEPALDAALAHDGHVRVIFRDWPIFGARSERAARVAIAADRQHLYTRVHSRLMRERRSLDPPVLRDAVEQAGGDWARLEADLRTHKEAIDRQLASNRAAAFGLGLPGTPGFLIGTTLVTGALDEGGFGRAFARGRKAAGSRTGRDG